MVSLFIFWTLVAHSLLIIAAQDFTPSSSWRSPNVTTSQDNRISIVSAALEKTLGYLQSDGSFNDSAYGTPGAFYAEMAEFDRITNQTTYKDVLKKYFPLIEADRSNFLDEFAYGYAAARAYEIYQDETFLNYAVTSWTSARAYTLSDADVSSGNTSVKSFSVQSTCQGITMAGGTFWETDSDNPSIVGLATGSFLVVSALLAEATGNETYLNAAIESATFIHSHLYNVENVVQDSISARKNDSCSVGSGTHPYNSGLFIEGLAILTSISGNASTQTLLQETVAAAVTNDAWQGNDGVIANGDSKSGDLLMMRGLGAVYWRNTTYSDMRNYVKEYIGVQYNAVLELATSNGTNVYGAEWVGPPSSDFQSDNQTIALSVLINGILLKDQEAPSSTSSSGSSSGSDSSSGSGSRSSSPTGPIAGGVIGGISILAIIGLVLFLRRRRRREKMRRSVVLDDDFSPSPVSLPAPTPFIMAPLTSSYSNSDRQQHSPTSSQRSEKMSAGGLSREGQSSSIGEKAALLHAQSTAILQESATRPSEPQPPVPEPVAGPSNEQPQRVDLPTEELVRLLNERLQAGGEWDEDELPPEYHREARIS
ncbi:uncharacterized protein BT62DRAFT_1009785 [Guyanagaster necrorhizus]|uniref:Glycoside hydrolase family 76 protein n=1 Tax=Guyanagaster necrorhizus TaxID=856835 RepID=A0A9P8AQU0_9AGAR|nr:uncharacterized protein BT62DRAFT_1009785 [Guyanagaster necrorhizus MCA 3950]KAG7443182.1 hypothetical protein BT62DRAFT_1009785 [Guyanagaster necrorhizus MCA 3950]